MRTYLTENEIVLDERQKAKLFAKNGVVDPISLALCFEDNADERIEASIEEYLEDYQW